MIPESLQRFFTKVGASEVVTVPQTESQLHALLEQLVEQLGSASTEMRCAILHALVHTEPALFLKKATEDWLKPLLETFYSDKKNCFREVHDRPKRDPQEAYLAAACLFQIAVDPCAEDSVRDKIYREVGLRTRRGEPHANTQGNSLLAVSKLFLREMLRTEEAPRVEAVLRDLISGSFRHSNSNSIGMWTNNYNDGPRKDLEDLLADK